MNIASGAARGQPSGRALRLRPKKGLSQEELTDLADINETYLSGVERGKRSAEALGA